MAARAAMSALEQKIASALADQAIASSAVAALVGEIVDAIAEAEAAAEAEREKALDLTVAPDAGEARKAMENAAFARDRLRTVLPKLRARLAEVEAAEYAAGWA